MFQVRSGEGDLGPWTYTVGAGAHLSENWDYGGLEQDCYDLSVFGPNGFFRRYQAGIRGKRGANLVSTATYAGDEPGITLEIKSRSRQRAELRIYDAYSGQTLRQHLEGGGVLVWHWALDPSHGWYDLTITVEGDAAFRQQLAGHVETGKPSISDPALGV